MQEQTSIWFLFPETEVFSIWKMTLKGTVTHPPPPLLTYRPNPVLLLRSPSMFLSFGFTTMCLLTGNTMGKTHFWCRSSIYFCFSLSLSPMGFFCNVFSLFSLFFSSVRRHETNIPRYSKRPRDDYSKSTRTELAWLANSVLSAPVKMGNLLFVNSVNCTDNKKISFVILKFEQHTKLCFFFN